MNRLNLTIFVFGVGFAVGGLAMNGLNAQTASKKNFHVGEDVGIIARGPEESPAHEPRVAVA